MNPRIFWLFSLLAGLAYASGCSSDRVQRNPAFHTTAGNASTQPAEGGAPTDGGAGIREPVAGSAPFTTAGDASGGSEPSQAGASQGGAPTEEPPFDCVLHPKTHLEIINACTDAARVEKHPKLPPLP